MLLDPQTCRLVLVDYQARLMPHIDEASRVLGQARLLAQMADALDVPIHVTEQTPDKLGETVEALQPWCDQVLHKRHFNACADGLLDMLTPSAAAAPQRGGNARSLPKHLRKVAPPVEAPRDTVVIAGVEAHICLMQTALGLLEQELDVWVVTDASGSCQVRQRDAAWDRLASAGAELVTAEMVAYEWLGDCDHFLFADALNWVKAARQS